MAKRRRRKKKDLLDYISLPRLPEIDLDPEIKKSILSIVLLILGALAMLSLFDLAGAMGTYVSAGLELVFGWGKWIFPLLLFLLGVSLFREDVFGSEGLSLFGLFLFIVSIQTLMHLFVRVDLWDKSIQNGEGGGYIGFFMARNFINVMGFWASLLIALGLLLIAIMLFFRTSLGGIIGREGFFAKLLWPFIFIFNKIFHREENEDDDEDDEEDNEDDDEDDEEDNEDDDEEDEEDEDDEEDEEDEEDNKEDEEEEEEEDEDEDDNDEEEASFNSKAINEYEANAAIANAQSKDKYWWQEKLDVDINIPIKLLNSKKRQTNFH